jgi:hypothetical protein
MKEIKDRGSVDPEEAIIGITSLLYFDILTHKESMYAMRQATSAGIRRKALRSSFCKLFVTDFQVSFQNRIFFRTMNHWQM